MLKIKNKIINSPIVIAPMAGISNGAFREICFEFGAGLVYSEMVSDKAIYFNNSKTKEMLYVDNCLHPVSLQIFGKDIDTMVNAAKVLDLETNCDFIDINMGCPVSKVVKTGAGAAMMLDEDNAVNVVKAIVENVSKPITVKMRLGYNSDNMNYLHLSQRLENVGVSMIALHARTRSQMYEGKADWSHIKRLKDNLNIPVIGNGDVKTLDDFIRMKESTGCDGVMIGRAVVGNPFLIKEISNYLDGHDNDYISIEDRFSYCLKHAKKLIQLKGERIGMSEMRGLAPHYISGLYEATTYKEKMNRMCSYSDLEKILYDYKDFLNKQCCK